MRKSWTVAEGGGREFKREEEREQRGTFPVGDGVLGRRVREIIAGRG